MNVNKYAEWVADIMSADGVTPDQVTPELAIAYFAEVGRKIERINCIYLTRDYAKEAMKNYVLEAVTRQPDGVGS